MFSRTMLLCGALVAVGASNAVREAIAEEGDGAPGWMSRLPGGSNQTRGGHCLWSDELLYQDWRIQRNVYTGHCRLLDGDDYRHAWGDFAWCRDKLEEIKRERGLPPMSGKAVIVLHGLAGTRKGMADICAFLRKQGGYTVLNMGYCSTRAPISEHAVSLGNVLARLEGVEEVNLVAHSMGNLVIRHYLADHMRSESDRRPDPRIRRIVMLAPPNQGSGVAAEWGDWKLVEWTLGPCSRELGLAWEDLSDKLAVPQCEFGIIAGGCQDDDGWCPRLPGDDDSIVSVAETRLPGAADFRVVPSLHAWVGEDEETQEYVLTFLRKGYFETEAKRKPVPRAEGDLAARSDTEGMRLRDATGERQRKHDR